MNNPNTDLEEAINIFEEEKVVENPYLNDEAKAKFEDNIEPAGEASPQEVEKKQDPIETGTQSQVEAPTNEDLKTTIKEAFEDVKASSQTQPEVSEKPQMSEEELAKILKKASFSVEDLKGLGLVNEELESEIAEQRVQALASLHGKMSQETKAYTELMVQAALEKVQAEIQPLRDYYAQTQQQAAEQEFYSQYPDLKDKTEIVDIVTQKLIKEGKLVEGKSTKEEVFDAVAKESQAFITRISPNSISATHKSQPVVNEVPKPATSTDTSRRSQESTKKTQESFLAEALAILD